MIPYATIRVFALFLGWVINTLLLEISAETLGIYNLLLSTFTLFTALALPGFFENVLQNGQSKSKIVDMKNMYFVVILLNIFPFYYLIPAPISDYKILILAGCLIYIVPRLFAPLLIAKGKQTKELFVDTVFRHSSFLLLCVAFPPKASIDVIYLFVIAQLLNVLFASILCRTEGRHLLGASSWANFLCALQTYAPKAFQFIIFNTLFTFMITYDALILSYSGISLDVIGRYKYTFFIISTASIPTIYMANLLRHHLSQNAQTGIELTRIRRSFIFSVFLIFTICSVFHILNVLEILNFDDFMVLSSFILGSSITCSHTMGFGYVVIIQKNYQNSRALLASLLVADLSIFLALFFLSSFNSIFIPVCFGALIFCNALIIRIYLGFRGEKVYDIFGN